jgi:hypothetical protein
LAPCHMANLHSPIMGMLIIGALLAAGLFQ